MALTEAVQRFNAEVAPRLAARIGVGEPAGKDPRFGRTGLFTYFADSTRFLVVAAEHDDNLGQLALALGLSYRSDKRLILVLPETHAFATMQRVPWLDEAARPIIWFHDGAQLVGDAPQPLRTSGQTVDQLVARLDGKTPAEDLRRAVTPVHLPSTGEGLCALVEWATVHPMLDAGHRQGERAWSCMGQKVLSIQATHGGTIRAGIHRKPPGNAPVSIALGKSGILARPQLTEIQTAVEVAVHERLAGRPPIHRDDEHWLQAVLRRRPQLLGMEPTALREVPAWRPTDTPSQWARGYIDLLGIDGHGNVRIVETKVSSNDDAMFILQGLDYYVWAQAYEQTLRHRFGVADSARFEVHYVVGADLLGEVHFSQHVAAQAKSLDGSMNWVFQAVRDWYQGPDEVSRAASTPEPQRTWYGTQPEVPAPRGEHNVGAPVQLTSSQ